MRKLKLSLKKEIISDLESKVVTGGAIDKTRYCHDTLMSKPPQCVKLTWGQMETCMITCTPETEDPYMCSSKAQSCAGYNHCN
ncbi:MAG: hypothetical protein N4A72_09955 [Bacteroidales bacterium]|jgi:hypothetical protein|nr:hypothetical protein [Bacteroidales bacterium]